MRARWRELDLNAGERYSRRRERQGPGPSELTNQPKNRRTYPSGSDGTAAQRQELGVGSANVLMKSLHGGRRGFYLGRGSRPLTRTRSHLRGPRRMPYPPQARE